MTIKYSDYKINAIISEQLNRAGIDEFYEIKFKGVFENINVEDYLKGNKLKRVQALLMVGLDQDILSKELSILSKTEHLLIEVAKYLLSKKEKLLLVNVLSALDQKHLVVITKVLKKITHKYHHTVLLFESNNELVYEISNMFYVAELNESLSKPMFQRKAKDTKEELLPETIKMSNYLNSKHNKTINNYFELSDLAKGIFRND